MSGIGFTRLMTDSYKNNRELLKKKHFDRENGASSHSKTIFKFRKGTQEEVLDVQRKVSREKRLDRIKLISVFSIFTIGIILAMIYFF